MPGSTRLVRRALRAALLSLGAAPLRVGAGGGLAVYAPLPVLAPRTVYVFDLTRGAR